MTRALWAGTALTATALLIRAACQAATFLVVARCFEPALYGQFVALVCIGILMAPLVTVGIEYVLVSMVATRRASTAACMGSGLLVLAMLSPLGIAAAALYIHAALDLAFEWRWTLLLLASEIVLVPWLEICWRAYQANERMAAVGLLRALPAVLKLLAASLLALGVYDASMANWAVAYSAATAAAVAVATLLTLRDFGLQLTGSVSTWRVAREGWPFAVYSLAERTTNDGDKLLLASLSGSRGAGLYAAGYRLVEVFVMPMMAGLITANAEIYRAGATSGSALRQLLRKLALPVAAYGLLAAGIIVAGADAAAYVLGAAYAGSAGPMRILSVLPLCYGLRVMLGFGLASIGRQLTRMIVQFLAALTSLALCLVVIPTYGPTGAATVTVVTEMLTIATLASLLRTREEVLRRGVPSTQD